MALVAYDESDNDSNITDDEEDLSAGNVKLVSKSSPVDLFTSLPKPKSENAEKVSALVEEQDDILLKREIPTEKPKKGPKKISIPSLDLQPDSDDEDTSNKKPLYSKHSGLFAILPPPKNTMISAKSFVPNVLKRKAAARTSANKKVAKVTARKVPKAKSDRSSDQSDSDDDLAGIGEEFDAQTWKQVCGRKQKKPAVVAAPQNQDFFREQLTTAPEPEKPYEGLDNEAFKKLVGSSKFVPTNVKLIDVNEEAISEDQILRTKAMTDPTIAPKADIENPVSSMHKRKHHIMYLAEQAKANEQELQNQWSANKFSRKQTQAKYGF